MQLGDLGDFGGFGGFGGCGGFGALAKLVGLGGRDAWRSMPPGLNPMGIRQHAPALGRQQTFVS